MAGLTKQHFIEIARIINNFKEDYKVLCGLDIDSIKLFINPLIDNLSDYFKTQNPLFNENQFKKACLE